MRVSFDCPKCIKPVVNDAVAIGNDLNCAGCGWTKAVDAGSLHDGSPTSCLVCGCSDLWRQKDFSAKLGVTIVGIGVAISTWFMMNMQPELSLGTLMVFALADMVLYGVMKDRLVCYRCHACYRNVPQTDRVAVFDLEVNERYRQEAIRKREAEASGKVS